MYNRLKDLDELLLRCRSKSSKEYLREAIVCYEAGAIRASIVSTWTAVFFDLIEKMKEISISGDKAATSLIERYERAESNDDLPSLLKFERDVLTSARKELELFSNLELIDLRRIQDDRHRCAHPTRNGMGERFVPSAEQARTHIVNSVEILLSQPPAQGKAVLENIVSLISSKLFPTDLKHAEVALMQTGLSRPRSSMLRNLIIVVIKNAVASSGGPSNYKFKTALQVIVRNHRTETLGVIESELSRVVRSVDDSNLGEVIWFLHGMPEIPGLLSADQKGRLIRFISSLGGADLNILDIALEISEFKMAATKRVERLDIAEIEASFFFDLPEAVRARVTQVLLESKSFDEANRACDLIRRYLMDFKSGELDEIKACGEKNDQVKYAFKFEELIANLESRQG